MQEKKKPAPAPSPTRVVPERRANTEPPGKIIELSNEQLLAMSDQELLQLVDWLGLSPPNPTTRDAMLGLVMKVALSAEDI